MPPNLRSSNSAQNSPSMTTRSSNHAASTNTTPMTTPTRKAPQCSICKRPRAGHPRSGCPYADSLSKDEPSTHNAAANHLTDALGSMVIASPAPMERDEDMKTFTRNRRRLSAQPPVLAPSTSLLSLSTDSRDIVERLSQPGIFDDPVDEDEQITKGKATRIVRWQETLQNMPTPNRAMKSRTSGRSPMPGTFMPPTPDSSFALSHSSIANPKIEPPSANSLNTAEDVSAEDHVSSSISSTSTRRPKPLTRTMSAMERDVFVSRLADESSATIYIVPKAEVDAITMEAAALNFIIHQVMNEDEDDPQALIILGRDERSVQALVDKVENENRKAQQSKNFQTPEKGRSNFKTAAGAAVVGAVGAWAGLAFS